jgi:hypothetical protein
MVTAFIMLTFTPSLFAQNLVFDKNADIPVLAEDLSRYPHDFNNEFYALNGVSPKAIINRRNGMDFLSVFSFSSNPNHRNIRVLATLPAYNQDGGILFWSPLGELDYNGFTGDVFGIEARQIADLFPVYVFPMHDETPFAFNNTRQAPLFDDMADTFHAKGNPLGLRTIIIVSFTDKAFNTKEGQEMMRVMSDKNGFSLDGTPLIKSKGEINELGKYEFISFQKRGLHEPQDPPIGTYAISPTIQHLEKSGIAEDAFLITVTQKGAVLPGEKMFVQQFGCLQKMGTWCMKY